MEAGYNAFYASWGASPTLRRIWAEQVAGEDFPREFDHISFLRRPVLARLTTALELAPGDVLADLACGAGGPGLWAASTTGARLLGIDLSTVAVDRASERAERLGMTARASFQRGSFAATGLEAASVDAAMTIDALQYAPDKREALGEVARILRDRGRFSFLAFELDGSRVEGLGVWDDPVDDYRPLLDEAGFDLLSYEQVDGWREDVRAGFSAVVEAQDRLTQELGDAAAAALVLEASITLEHEPYSGHVHAVAERRTRS